MLIPEARTATQRQNHGYLMDVMAQLEWDMHQPIIARRRIPPEWREIYDRRFESRKKKVTLWVEEDVVRFFKKQGAGYTTRMNKVLVAFMLARLSGLIVHRDTAEEFLESDLQKRSDGERHQFGDTDQYEADLFERARLRRAAREVEGEGGGDFDQGAEYAAK